jgi:hypothetical protein
VIREFEDMQASQARAYRALFGLGAAAFAAFFLHAAREQSVRPWEVRYTGELRTVADGGAVVAAFLVQAASLAAAAAALLARLPPAPRSRAAALARLRGGCGGGCLPPAAGGAAAGAALAAAALGAAAGGAFWAAALRRSVRRYGWERGAHPELLWLPLGPPAYVGVCWLVLRSVAATGREIERLRQLTYTYKKV